MSFKERYLKALAIASEAHFGQTRSGSYLPYITHPIAVAAIGDQYDLGENTVLALLLHDSIEDGGDRKRFALKIQLQLGNEVLEIAEGLTDPEFPEGTPRKERKKAINDRLSQLPFEIQMAKLCDVMHNTHDVKDAKPKFAKKYLAEKLAQLEIMSSEVKETQLYRDVFSQIGSHVKKTEMTASPSNH